MGFIVSGTPIGYSAVFLTVFASMGGFLFGYDTGQIADIEPMPDFLRRFGQPDPNNPGEFYLTHVRSGLIVGLLSIGTLFGALAGGSISDFLGRRRAMSVASLVVCVGIAVQISSHHVWQQYAVGRLIAGIGIGSLSANVPIYQSELAPKQIRGTLVATYQLFITLGILIAYSFGIGTRKLAGAAAWRVLVGLGMVFASIIGIGINFMPESPRWLIKKGRSEEARHSLCRVRGVTEADNDPYVEHDYNEIMIGVDADEREGAGTWAECFGRKMIKRTMLGILLQMFQQLTGANYFFYYGATVFQGVGINDSYVTQIILGAVNVVTTFPGLWFLERFGRRRPLIYGGAWQSAWLFAYAIAGTVRDPATDIQVGKFMIVATCFFIAGFASTWGPGIWIVTGEMFPQRTRAKNQAMSVASNWLWNFLLAFFTPFITGSIGYTYGFVFAGCNFAGMAMVYFFVKEGGGLSLEQYQLLWEDRQCPAWRSETWVPPGYAHRRDAAEANAAEKKKVAPTAGEHIEQAPVQEKSTRFPNNESPSPASSV